MCVCVCVRPSGDFGSFRNNIWVRDMILPSIKNHARFLGIFKTEIKKERNEKWVPKKNMVFRKKFPPYSRTISDEKSDSVQKNSTELVRKTLII